MPNITVNPTRMELTRLKGKLRTAQRGHKLLKDKRDELMKQFLDTVREVRALRQEVEEELMTVHGAFTVASALMSSQALEQALLDPKQSVKLTQTTKNIMSVNVPVYDFQTQTRSDADIYPYGFAATSGELDTAVDALGKVFRKMLKLAEVEKSAQLMAEEIEKDPPPGERSGVRGDPKHPGRHPVYHHEAGRERPGHHHPFDEGEGYAAAAVHRGTAAAGRGSAGAVPGGLTKYAKRCRIITLHRFAAFNALERKKSNYALRDKHPRGPVLAGRL